MQTLLFNESPLIAFFIVIIILILTYKHYCGGSIIFTIIFVVLIFFYRHYPINERFADGIVISPADGVIQYIEETNNEITIGIFLGVYNIHTQVYPINGRVTNRVYDHTGKFGLVVDGSKSRDNEKKIHTLMAMDGRRVTITQIAGFIPRRISSSDDINIDVQAGEYLGIIKLGSRVDLTITKPFENQLTVGDRVHVADVLGKLR